MLHLFEYLFEISFHVLNFSKKNIFPSCNEQTICYIPLEKQGPDTGYIPFC